MLHGFGSNEQDLFTLAKIIAPDFTVFSLRAPLSTGRGGYCWYKLEFLPNQKFRHDYAQAKISRDQIMSFIRSACRSFNLDSNNVYLLGFSQGAIMSYELAMSGPGAIRGIVALSGSMMENSQEAIKEPDKIKKLRYFIAHGTADDVIRIADGEKAAAFLKEKGVTDLTFRKYPMRHNISEAELQDIKAWLKAGK
jgi:phospholipase/carboxylesterase